METGFGPSPDRQQPGSQQQPGHPGQPGYGDAGYQPGYGAAAYQPGAATGRNPAGRFSLTAGILVVLVGLVQQVVAYALPYVVDHSDLSVATTYRNVNLVGAAVTIAIALVALIAGGIGLSGSGKPKGAAAAGFALGAAALVSSLFGLLGPVVVGSLF